jgi:hypothetical protein
MCHAGAAQIPPLAHNQDGLRETAQAIKREGCLGVTEAQQQNGRANLSPVRFRPT